MVLKFPWWFFFLEKMNGTLGNGTRLGFSLLGECVRLTYDFDMLPANSGELSKRIARARNMQQMDHLSVRLLVLPWFLWNVNRLITIQSLLPSEQDRVIHEFSIVGKLIRFFWMIRHAMFRSNMPLRAMDVLHIFCISRADSQRFVDHLHYMTWSLYPGFASHRLLRKRWTFPEKWPHIM